ncbi:MAG: beta-aspartyl-peptidase [Bacteroidetes bacterium]|nr:MAG: beta-aspartyl-peptidase [Bacteroidota bacterium]
MLRLFFVLLLGLNLQAQNKNYQIIIHGGAGNGLKAENYSEAQIEAFHQSLHQAIAKGDSALQKGTKAIEVVSLVIQQLENDSLFNAGKGAVLTYEGLASLDASIMDGKTGNAGAVAGLSCIKNPITAALAVLNNSPHVLLSGAGADTFSLQNGLTQVDPSYFVTQRMKGIHESIKGHQGALDSIRDFKMGTVGCVVRDRKGNIAAGTSTGGMMNKRYGRIGDSPIIGAGTFASNATLGISCTGHGEYFIRHAVAYQISARYEFQGLSSQEAADTVLHEVLKPGAGDGGVIGIDKEGNFIISFNTAGMLRAFKQEGEAVQSYIFGEGEK